MIRVTSLIILLLRQAQFRILRLYSTQGMQYHVNSVLKVILVIATIIEESGFISLLALKYSILSTQMIF